MRVPIAAIVLTLVWLVQLGPAAGGAGAATADAAGRTGAERAIRACANRVRRARGLAPLRASGVLTRAARFHARNMARQGFFAHTDPQGRDVGDRVAIFAGGRRFVVIGENIAAGYRSAREACRSWLRSPAHRRNILNRGYTQIGGGFHRGGPMGRYYVQVFGRPAGRR